jgi:hypothetical protein
LSRIESGKLDARLRSEPLCGSHSRRTGDDFYLSNSDFFSRLRLIAAIGKQARTAAGNGQRSAGACESGEIAKIGKIGNQQAMKPGLSQTAA